MLRIFLALTPEKELNNQIVEIKKDLKSNLLKDAQVAWQRNDHHHVTVYFVGEMEPEQLQQMIEGLDEISLIKLSRSIEITTVSFFPNENSQVLVALVRPNKLLQKLHEKVKKTVTTIGLGSDLKDYKPHITLGRFKEKDRPQYEFEVLEETLKGKIKQLDIFNSEFDEGKTKYTLIKSFEL